MRVSSGRWRSLGEVLIEDVLELLDRGVAPRLQPELHAAGRAQTRNRGRIDRQHDRLLDRGEGFRGRRDDGGCLQRGFLALVEVLQADEENPGVVLGLRVENAVAAHHHGGVGGGILGEEVGDLSADFSGALEACRIRQDDRAQQITLILGRQERRGDLLEQAERQEQHPREEQQRDHDALDDERDAAGVAVGEPRETPLEPGEEATLRPVSRLEQQGGQRGRQGQRDDARDHHRDRDRDRELLVELPGDAAQERHRHEHRAQHEHDGDHRSADLVHRALRGRDGREPVFVHVALDVLDHHDRVVHHDADGEHHAEQRQHVDREAERDHAR